MESRSGCRAVLVPRKLSGKIRDQTGQQDDGQAEIEFGFTRHVRAVSNCGLVAIESGTALGKRIYLRDASLHRKKSCRMGGT